MNRLIHLVAICLLFPVTALSFGQSAGGEKNDSRLSVALAAGELTLDPVHAYRTTELQIATGLYEGLVVYNPRTLQPAPGAAFRWDISEDGTVYRFHLRQRAKFSNGEAVTARDFRQSWLRVLDPAAEGEYSFFFDVIKGAAAYRSGKSADSGSVGIYVVDEYTLEVELARPASHFLSMLCHMTFAPIYSAYRSTVGWEHGKSLITNGPYALRSWDSKGMVLARSPFYWDALNVAIETIDISFAPGAEAATRALNSGELDWSLSADPSGLNNQKSIRVTPLFATSYLYFRADAPPWSDSRVRKGLALLVPWNTVRKGVASFATDTLVPALGFYPKVEGLTDADVEAGLALLSDAGFPKGAGLPAITVLVIPGSIAEEAAGKIKSFWEELLDVTVEVENVSFREYQREVRNGGYALGSSTWIGDFADPLAFLQMWTGGSNLNDARFRDDGYDELLNAAMGETGEKRFGTLSQAEQRLLTEDVLVLPLSHTFSVNFIDLSRIGGWYENALDIHPLKYLRFRNTVPLRYAGDFDGRIVQREAASS